MPLGASRLTLLAFQASVAASATVIRKKVGATAIGNAKIDTSRYRWGGSSALFDGTGDYIVADLNTDVLGTGAFTWECWFNVDNDAGDGTVALLSNRNGGGVAGNIQVLFRNFDMKIQVNGYGGTSAFDANGIGPALAVDTWHHVAFCRDDSNNVSIFINGNNESTGSTWDATVNSDTDSLPFGIGAHPSGSIPFNSGNNGWIDEVRISNTNRYTAENFVPSGPFVNDDNTVLLLHMDGTVNSTTFIDDNGASTAELNEDASAGNLKLAVPFDNTNGINDVAKDITGTGVTSAATVTQGTCSVVSGGAYWPWYNSVLINNNTGGSGLTYVPASAFGAASSASYTVEVWVRATDSTSNNNWALSSADSGGRWLFGINTGSSYGFGNENNIGLGDTNWHHIAIVNNGGTKSFYTDGVYKGAWYSTNSGFSTLHVGQFTTNSSNEFQGNMQDLRVYNNAKYSGTDSSNANFKLPAPIKKVYPQMPSTRAEGNADVDTSNAKFGGSSVAFDGNGDNLRVFPQWDLTNPWTLEFFFYTGSTATQNLFGMTQSAVSTESSSIFIRTNGGKVQVYTSVSGSSWDGLSGTYTGSYNTNSWNHYALQWDGTNMKQFLNGSESTSATHAQVFDNRYYENWFGGAYGSTAWFSGAFDEIRISGTARYSGNYTVPTAAFVPDTNTKFLLHCNGTNNSQDFIPDAGVTRSAIGLEAENNTHISTDQKQFSVSSAEFDGSSDILVTNGPNLGSSQWTIEMWARFDSVSGVRVLYDDRESANNSTGTILLYTNGTTLYFNSQGVNKITGGVTLATNTWYHIAVSKDGSNNVRLFVDGSETGSSYTDANTFAQPDGEGYFGANHQSPGQHGLDGYIDEIRFSNTARYTSNFTPSTTQFQNDTNTLLLIHADGSNNSTTFIDDNGKEA